jgi:hypothetical protein
MGGHKVLVQLLFPCLRVVALLRLVLCIALHTLCRRRWQHGKTIESSKLLGTIIESETIDIATTVVPNALLHVQRRAHPCSGELRLQGGGLLGSFEPVPLHIQSQ